MPGRHPLLIFGLDGATFDVMGPLFANGDLPALRRFAEHGLRAELRSTFPPATLPAWTSFLTAAEPARHGVSDLLVRQEHSYALAPANATLRTEPTFLTRLSALGLRVASVGVPGTYPPEPVNGLCLSGFDAPGVRRARKSAFYPPELCADVARLGGWRYASFNEHSKSERRPVRAIRALCADIARKRDIILSLYRREPWDVFFVHLQAADTAGHHLWHAYDPRSPRRGRTELQGALPEIYRRLDALVADVLAEAPARARVLVVSDHGMGGAGVVAVHLNRWLAEQGLLTFKSNAGQSLSRVLGRVLRATLAVVPAEILGTAISYSPAPLRARLLELARASAVDFIRSQAFSDELDYAPAIWLNRRSRFPRGHLSDDEADALARRIATDLLGLHDPASGLPLIRAVHQRATLCHGSHLERFPDLMIEPAWPDGYRPSFVPSRGPGPVVRTLNPTEYHGAKDAGLPGVHRREGILLAYGPDVPEADLPPLEIAQAGALVYPLLGLPAPDGLGAELPAFILDLLPAMDAPAHMPCSRAAPVSEQPRGADGYTASERAEVLRRLSDLGYIE